LAWHIHLWFTHLELLLFKRAGGLPPFPNTLPAGNHPARSCSYRRGGGTPGVE
jgi:hypothetical protein